MNAEGFVKRNRILSFILFIMVSVISMAQNVSGMVVDAETKIPIIGARVSVPGTDFTSVSDDYGKFMLHTDAAHNMIRVECIGYNAVEQRITPTRNGYANLGKDEKVNVGVIEMEMQTVLMKDVVISSSMGIARKTPIAMSNVNSVQIDEMLGNQEFPEILKGTPGVYARKGSGGFGDSKLNMRGFQSPNVAVMVNGVPMNDMEWGGVYWSNWAGLSDVARNVQAQRGLGASKVSAPSVGGSINIVTRTIEQEKGGSFTYGLGDNGSNMVSLVLSSGLSKKGWGFTFMGGKKWGDGYVQGAEYEAYNYFASIYKRLGMRHMLSLTAFGAPQSHNQRNQYDGLTVEGWQQVRNYMKGLSPYRYNATFGYGKNGERKTSSYNFYHKPQVSLNHTWEINQKSTLSTALYMSIGHGYGNSGIGVNSTYGNYWYGASNGVLNMKFRNADGTYAYDQVQDLNEKSTSGSLMAMSRTYNNHLWYGLISTYNTKLMPHVDAYVGVDLRNYKGTHKNKLSDLYNGAYFTDLRYRSNVDPELNSKAADPMWKYEKLGVGDVVYRDYDSHVSQQGVFGQVEYNNDENVSAFISGSLSNSRYWRYGRFYYDKAHAKSRKIDFTGFTVKGGVNYNIDDYQNVFANVGYISRAPFFSGGVFLMADASNKVNPDAVNEKTFSTELGYMFKNNWVRASVNAYYTLWLDKTTTKWGSMTQSKDNYIMNMDGVDAKHMGVEIDVLAMPTPWLDINAMLSLGNWKWNSNATAYFYDSASQPLADLTTGAIASGVGAPDHVKFTLNQKGVHVGGAPQTTMALGFTVRPTKALSAGADFTYYARNYADFTMPSSTSSSEFTLKEPWKIPAAGQLDLKARYRFKVGTCNASLIGNVYNVFNYEYIADASYDGTHADWRDSYRIFYAFGRTYNVKLRVEF